MTCHAECSFARAAAAGQSGRMQANHSNLLVQLQEFFAAHIEPNAAAYLEEHAANRQTKHYLRSVRNYIAAYVSRHLLAYFAI